MQEAIENLPVDTTDEDITGVRAPGKARRDDHGAALGAALEQAEKTGRRVRLLYELGPDLRSFSLGATLEEAELIARRAASLQRCALVVGSSATRKLASGALSLLPVTARVFESEERGRAIAWLRDPPRPRGLTPVLRPEVGLLIIHAHGTLHTEDFEALTDLIDTHTTSGESPVSGIVIRTEGKPSWDSVGSFLRHLEFVRATQGKVRRVAIVTDATLVGTVAGAITPFVHPDVRAFPLERMAEAEVWAAGMGHRPSSGPASVDRARPRDPVDEAGLESFPASDPPSY